MSQSRWPNHILHRWEKENRFCSGIRRQRGWCRRYCGRCGGWRNCGTNRGRTRKRKKVSEQRELDRSKAKLNSFSFFRKAGLKRKQKFSLWRQKFMASIHTIGLETEEVTIPYTDVLYAVYKYIYDTNFTLRPSIKAT